MGKQSSNVRVTTNINIGKDVRRISDRNSREVRKESIDFHINDETCLETGKPIDFSFKKYKSLEAIGIEGARTSRIGQLPVKSDNQKFLTRALWLNNNKLNAISNMNMFVESILQEPSELAWVDFSFNYIKDIDDIILNYKSLKIVYFHGNLINNMDEIKKLASLKELRSVTFHGNPIAKHEKYRAFIISLLPQVVNIDFTPILKSERLMPIPPEALRKLSVELGFDDEGEDEDEDWLKFIKEKRHHEKMKLLEDEIDADKEEFEKSKQDKDDDELEELEKDLNKEEEEKE